MNLWDALEEELFALMAARRGHFVVESGHHGDLWLDVDRLFVDVRRVRALAVPLADRLAAYELAAICGPLTGGAFLAQILAEELRVPWVYANRTVQRSAQTLFPVDYSIPAELLEFVRGRRVGVVNDVINAGSAVRGTLESLKAAASEIVVIGALAVLGDAPDALAKVAGVPLEALVCAPNQLWTPAACPLCSAGAPLAPLAW